MIVRVDIDDSPDRPAWLTELRAEVDAAFVATGASTPGWADPWPDRDVPEAAYSRCEDPGRYRILKTRLDAWVEVVSARGIATVAEVGATDLTWQGSWNDATPRGRTRRLDPVRSGGLSVVLAETAADGAPFGLDVAVARRGDPTVVFVERVPDCGCDACDSGSADLLGVLDDWVMTVARGGVVHVQHDDASVSRTWDGWQSSGRADERWLDEPDTAPRSAAVWRGEPWSEEA